MMKIICVILLVPFFFLFVKGEETVTVETSFGKIVGKKREFLGIPFAKPPVKDLRFRSPQVNFKSFLLSFSDQIRKWKGGKEFGMAHMRGIGVYKADT